MRRLSLFLLSALVGTVFPSSAAPYVGYAYPSGVQTGTTARVVIGGQALRGVNGVWVSGDGVSVTKVSQVPDFPYFNSYGYREWAKKWVDVVARAKLLGQSDLSGVRPDIPTGNDRRFWPKCAWWERISELDSLEFAVTARDLHTKRDQLQEIAAISQLLIVDIAVASDAAPGTRDLIVYDGKGASAPHPFLVTVEPHAAEPRFAPPFAAVTNVLAHVPPVVLDGRILPREADVFALRLTEGRRLVCELVGRELKPYIGDAVPGFFNPVLRLTDEKGNELAVVDDYAYLPDPVLVFDVQTSGVYRLEIRDNLFRGRPDFVYSVVCRETDQQVPPPLVCDRAFVCGRPFARTEAPVDVLPHSGASSTHEIRVDTPGRWTFDLFARRIGSPLDGVLRLCSHDGGTLAVWDDVTNAVHVGGVPQAECDPRGEWTFAEAGRYQLRVSDRIGQGGRDYRYSLVAAPARPAFEAYAEKSSFLIGKGDRGKATFKVRVVRRNGFAGAVALDDTEDFAFSPGLVSETNDVAEVTAVARDGKWQGVKSVSFTASAVASDGPKGVRVVPADTVEQAFAYAHLLPASDFRFLRPTPIRPEPPAPEWIAMPVDIFSPGRFVYFSAELDPSAAVIQALATAEAPIVRIPSDAGDALLASRLSVACAHVTPPRRGFPVVRLSEGASLSAEACARAVLAGAKRVVMPDGRYAEDDPVLVRTFAFAAKFRSDNDVLLLAPDGPISFDGPLGKGARALRDSGYCFDYVTPAMLTNAQTVARYRTLFVPKDEQVLSPSVVDVLFAKAKSGWTVLFEDALPDDPDVTAKVKDGEAKHGKGRLVVGDWQKLVGAKTPARRERFSGLDQLRFARFSSPGGALYFIHNPTQQGVTVSGRLGQPRPAKTAAVMNVRTADIESLPLKKNGSITLTLPPKESVWVVAGW